MPHNITGTNVFTDPVPALADGDPVAQASNDPAFQALANRDVYIGTRLGIAEVTLAAIDAIVLSQGQILGTATNDAAAAGNIGQYVEALRVYNSRIAMTAATPYVVGGPLTLGAGDWDISGQLEFTATGTGDIVALGAIRIGSDFSGGGQYGAPESNQCRIEDRYSVMVNGFDSHRMVFTPFRLTLATSSAYSLLAEANSFSTATLSVHGWLHARRVR